MTDQQQMPPGWYPDPMAAGHQREWNGQEWVGPSVPVGGKKKGGFPKWLIPVIACLALAFVAVIGAALAGDTEDDADTASARETTTTAEEPETTTEAEEEPTTEEEATTTEAPTTTTAPASTEPAREQYEGQDLYRVGETATSGEFDITLHTVTDPWTSGNQFETPGVGMRFVAIEASITNNGSTAITFSSYAGLAEVKDDQNRVWDPAFAGLDLPQLDGEVAPGATRRGWTVYEVGGDSAGLVIRMKGNFTATGSVFALS